jgi:prephenate dehydrogenase
VIGVGLLGGSVGLAARRAWPDVEVVGVARNRETLDAALEHGAATQVSDDLLAAVREADFICVGTPVTLIAAQVIQAASVCRDQAIITDVGSTKESIVQHVERDATARRKFVGSHPIAGGEKSGPQFARADLFDQKLVVITPTESTDPERAVKVEMFWQSLGAHVATTTPQGHDELLAAASHLPHLVAAALAAIIPESAVPFAGPGWRDTTRVAGGCPEMWSAICQENSTAIVDQLDRMIEVLLSLKKAVASDDSASIEALLALAKQNRRKVVGDP